MKQSGTTLREAGIYTWQEKDREPRYYVSVTEVLDSIANFTEARERWISQYVVRELATAVYENTTIPIWHGGKQPRWKKPGLGKMVHVPAVSILYNSLPVLDSLEDQWETTDKYTGESIVRWPSNHGENFIRGASQRELTKTAHRGDIMHAAMNEWSQSAINGLYGSDNAVYHADPDLPSWVVSELQRPRPGYPKGYTIKSRDVYPYVEAALRFCEEKIACIEYADVAVFNEYYCYAGTIDQAGVKLRDVEGVGILDWKSRVNPFVSDIWQQCAYLYAETMSPDNETRIVMPHYDWIGNVYVGHNGKFDSDGDPIMEARYRIWPVEEYPKHYQAFLCARNIYQVKNDFSAAGTLDKKKKLKPVTVSVGDLEIPKKQGRKIKKVEEQNAQ